MIKCACGCGQLRPKFDKQGRERKYVAGHQTRGRRGPKSPLWKGGRFLHTLGYMMAYCPDHPSAIGKTGYVYEHRRVMEKHIGRYLKSEEHVHHINGDRADNRIENLKITSFAEHMGEKEHADKQRNTWWKPLKNNPMVKVK